MKTSDMLFAATKELWAAYNLHPFVLGIQSGTLSHEKFRHYILQDALYLQDYARVFALGFAKSQSDVTRDMFAGYIASMNAELNMHKGYQQEFGITAAELSATRPALDNLSYTSYMLRVAYEEGETEILAAVLACACSYELIAKTMLKNNPAAGHHPFYGTWINGYASGAYAAENARLLAILDDLGARDTEAQRAHLAEIFVACSRYEHAFWDMAWEMRE